MEKKTIEYTQQNKFISLAPTNTITTKALWKGPNLDQGTRKERKLRSITDAHQRVKQKIETWSACTLVEIALENNIE